MVSLKKFLSIGLASALLVTGAVAVNANAATIGTTSGTTNATLKVDSSDGTLNLDSVPTFDFGTASASDFLNGATKPLTNKNDDNILKITDTRGMGNGAWNLNATLTKDFTAGDSTLSDAKLNIGFIGGTNTTSSTGFTQTTQGTTLTGGTAPTAGTVVANDQAFAGVSVYKFTSTSGSGGVPGATLTLPTTTTFADGNYTGEVTWTLTSAQ